MTTFTYTTDSEPAAVTSPTQVESLLNKFESTVAVDCVKGCIRFHGESDPFAIHDHDGTDVTKQALRELAKYLEEYLEIVCVETGGEGVPAAWKWTVAPDGGTGGGEGLAVRSEL